MAAGSSAIAARPRIDILNRSRVSQVALLIGVISLGILWHVVVSEKFTVKESSSYDNVTEQEEEDFVTSTRSAITTVDLPVIENYDKPLMDENKPTLFLHVGPVKTGVLSLARKLSRIQELADALNKDNYVLVRPTSDDEPNIKSPIDLTALHHGCQSELNQVRREWEASVNKGKHKYTLEEYIDMVPCWKTFREQLRVLHNTKTNLIISDEMLSQQLLLDAVAVNGGPAVLEWITLRETILPEWNIVVVVTYRRYYEWLLAAKARAEQVHSQQHSSETPRLARWPGSEHGMLLEPLFPRFVQNAVEKLDVPYTYRILKFYEPFVSEVRLLNLHDHWPSMITAFACDVLHAAPTTCSQSQRLMDETTLLSSNDELLDLASDQKWYNWQKYDELVTEAARRMYIRSKRCTRTAATHTTEYYVQVHLGQTARDLPLICPQPADAQKLLNESRRYEKRLMPEFAASQLDEHERQFWEWTKTKAYCSINMPALLSKSDWRTFFRHLTNQSAEKIRSGDRHPLTPGRLLRI